MAMISETEILLLVSIVEKIDYAFVGYLYEEKKQTGP